MPLLIQVYKYILQHVTCFCIGKSLKSMNAYNEIFDVKWEVSYINKTQYIFEMGPSRYKFFLCPSSPLHPFLICRKAMAPHSSTFAQKIPWTEEPGRLQSMGSLESDTTERLHFHFSLSCIGERNGNPLQCSCLENPRDGGAWWATVYGIAQSWTRLK